MLILRRATAFLAISRLRQQLVLQAEFGEHLLQPAVLVIDGLHLADQGRIHAAILRPPLVERGVAHALLAAQRSTCIPPSACRRIARICAYVYLIVFIRNLLMHLAEKILLMQPLTFGGITSAYIFGQDAEQSGIASAADHTAGHTLQRYPVLASRDKPRHADADVF